MKYSLELFESIYFQCHCCTAEMLVLIRKGDSWYHSSHDDLRIIKDFPLSENVHEWDGNGIRTDSLASSMEGIYYFTEIHACCNADEIQVILFKHYPTEDIEIQARAKHDDISSTLSVGASENEYLLWRAYVITRDSSSLFDIRKTNDLLTIEDLRQTGIFSNK